eukprot:CAMPEP_0119309494 /NCGR_PEP_ID=MMETSP1333-20130426/15799_1 /TAXON_ID=418940 /ORGANISM="Scyphosphaera apsteinii, Strain RCC1455" /LENGTH=105 /DNA_ID=CAMNT_0007313483 /DNA_START=13 /DNA_END=330 /DNA_ORIENTATION=-
MPEMASTEQDLVANDLSAYVESASGVGPYPHHQRTQESRLMMWLLRVALPALALGCIVLAFSICAIRRWRMRRRITLIWQQHIAEQQPLNQRFLSPSINYSTRIQ